MNRLFSSFITLVTLLAFLQTQVLSQTRERAQVPVEHTWKLEDLYTSDEAWNKAKQKWAAQFDKILKYKGKLASSASELFACLEFNSDISKEYNRLYCYAAMKSDQDIRDSKYLALKQELQQLATDYSSKA
jgi:oligoendopeptidase F